MGMTAQVSIRLAVESSLTTQWKLSNFSCHITSLWYQGATVLQLFPLFGYHLGDKNVHCCVSFRTMSVLYIGHVGKRNARSRRC